MRNIYLPLAFLLITLSSVAQQPSGFDKRPRLKIKSYNIGYRLFEIDHFGNNPTTIAPLLKNPRSYNAYINTINWNSMAGNPGIHVPKTLNVGMSFYKPQSPSQF